MNDRICVEPMDEYNEALVRNVHPSEWVNPTPSGRYNLVVIGAGSAGLVTAAGAAGLGAKVALIEKHLLGGDCLNVGCVPSKSLIRSSRVCADISSAQEYGISVPGDPKVDFSAVMRRVRRLRATISAHDSAARFSDLGVDVFFGKAVFSGLDTVEVSGQTLRFKKAVVATGARPATPRVDGLAEAGFLTNETIFSLTERPNHLAVIGGGPIGCELAQAFRRLGSEVTIVEKGTQFLPWGDPDAATILSRVFQREGIRVLLGSTVQRVTRVDGKNIIYVAREGSALTVEADEILVGAGRTPNTEGLNLEKARVEYHKAKGISVNDYLQTTNPHIYAAGDICLNYKFTHTADATARIVIQNALFWGRKKLSALTIPWCIYTDPEIAHVGIYPGKTGIPIQTFTRKLRDVDRAVTDSEEEGFVRIHLKKGADKIVGATIVARHAGEMISEITVAMTGGIGLGTVANTIHPYPTQSEAIKQVADAYNRTRLTPFLKNIFRRLLAWRR